MRRCGFHLFNLLVSCPFSFALSRSFFPCALAPLGFQSRRTLVRARSWSSGKSNGFVTVWLIATEAVDSPRMAAMLNLHLSCADGARRIGIQRAAARHRSLIFLISAAISVDPRIQRAGDRRREAVVAPAAQAKVQNPISNESSLAAGEKIYMKRCAACQKMGNGDADGSILAFIPRSSPTQNSVGLGRSLLRKVRKAKKYGSRLSKTNSWNVVNFVRTLTARLTRS